MSTINLNGLQVSENSFNRARQIVENRGNSNRRLTTTDVLSSLREMMPGWNISTSSDNWGEGFRNIEIDNATLREMANDPEAMVRFKALILDFEEMVPTLEEWSAQNEGSTINLGFSIDEEGNARVLSLVRTLLGEETSNTFDLPRGSSWVDFMRQRLLGDGQADSETGSRTWLA